MFTIRFTILCVYLHKHFFCKISSLKKKEGIFFNSNPFKSVRVFINLDNYLRNNFKTLRQLQKMKDFKEIRIRSGSNFIISCKTHFKFSDQRLIKGLYITKKILNDSIKH